MKTRFWENETWFIGKQNSHFFVFLRENNQPWKGMHGYYLLQKLRIGSYRGGAVKSVSVY